ncbi:putative trans-sulfuration enzyme [Cyphellophora attinorum]|uniref:Putative trans-sulfuration enzyme n=1 Tax=Cyphellophora attinorum TaxID=1664694 RepID=A0A0N1HB37_9EURO|nr:putative trans-sulfuration enzyme [Phialophora attinorum]KPI41195.1 putative trans-sulfuration enzyme [Phialophora attinorum]
MSPPRANGTNGNNHVEAADLNKNPPVPVDDDAAERLQELNLEILSPSTRAIHADDALNVLADVAPPVHVSTTFRYAKDPANLTPSHLRSDPLGSTEHIYSRYSTHSTSRLETILETLLHAPCLTYSSGLSAFYALLVFLRPKRVAIGDGYHGCHGVLDLYMRTSKCEKLPLDCKPEELDEGNLIALETPVNPTGKAFNIQHYADIARSRRAYLMVDSTFAPPPLQDPFRHGADFVMHSGTKYIGGHSDMLCGVLAVKNKASLAPMKKDRHFLGSVMGGLEGWLGVRSVRTLELRVMRQADTAERIVQALDYALSGHSVGTGLSKSDVEAIQAVVREVHHASLQEADKKTWLRKQMPKGYGPVFSIVMKEDVFAKHLPSKLNLFHHATSLGGVESLIEWRTMSDATVSPDMLRVSIGIEDYQDLLDDLLQAFREVAKLRQS